MIGVASEGVTAEMGDTVTPADSVVTSRSLIGTGS